MELLQVDKGIYHLKMHFLVIRYQMSHCYLFFRSKTNMKKWYFEYFIADYFLTLFYEHPVEHLSHIFIWKAMQHQQLLCCMKHLKLCKLHSTNWHFLVWNTTPYRKKLFYCACVLLSKKLPTRIWLHVCLS